MSMVNRKRLGDLLTESGMVTVEEVNRALNEKSQSEKLGDWLIKESIITERQLIEVLEFQLGIPHVELNRYKIDTDLIQLIPSELAKENLIIPLKKERNKLYVAMADPMDYFAIEELRMATGCQIEPSIAAKDDLNRNVMKFYDIQNSMNEALMDLAMNENESEADLTNLDSPIVRLVNQIIAGAAAQQSSDIHFDPHEDEVLVRYRVDGMMQTERSLPKHMQNIVIARLKIMGGLNITESRIPQDGRIKSVINDHTIDIRISSLPTIYGEKIVLRIHDLNNALTDLSKLDFTTENYSLFLNMISKPNGIVLITGPTGSGKSSTLYSALHYLNEESVNILTVEDPVEYQLKGINQIQMNEEIGFTFASGLRSILRQDPDIVMLGEIRDQETAEIAIRASLTGHLVLSTLHTNSSIETVTRLIDMGIQPFLLSSSLSGIVAQRLVRKICRDCKESYVPDEREKALFAKEGVHYTELFRGKGCSSCNGTGYKGRMAIHEVLEVDDELKDLIIKKAGSTAIKAHAERKKTPFLVKDGLQKAADGLTTLKEVLRVTTLS
ncbi:GspE/PulE family protein [Jeotgalibacillus sp. R-1-5s-1]|uniref:GspE/PulE family protein n=1 Tax=Jeotgalibacillus sp. R-1-5s-1 TaxID=2555897 RepID=UPI001069B0FB|nr:ATPase, T2SS/T4P/T4SS family [Jeotgalibacillus sp. R-1-5s-1]TFD92426.1 type II secretion system protein GspE [Jeotgalibacillus sp. R-1-5s-1]